MSRGLTLWIDPTQIYGRQELSALTGVSDDVLSFWIKRKLLLPEDAAAGKGVHHKFHYSQVSIAVVLKVVRENFGANIATLKSLSDTLQLGCRMFRKTKASVSAWGSAVYLADRLHRFRQGERFEVFVVNDDTDDLERRIAATEADVILDSLVKADHGLQNAVIRLADQIGPGHEREYEVALQLLGTVLDPRYSNGYWLLANNGGQWTVFHDSDESNTDRSGIGPAMFLPIGRLVREPWGIPSTAMLRALDAGLQLEAVAADHGLDIRVLVQNDEGAATFDGPDADNPAFAELLKRWKMPDHWAEKMGVEPIKNKHNGLLWTSEHQRERGLK